MVTRRDTGRRTDGSAGAVSPRGLLIVVVAGLVAMLAAITAGAATWQPVWLGLTTAAATWCLTFISLVCSLHKLVDRG